MQNSNTLWTGTKNSMNQTSLTEKEEVNDTLEIVHEMSQILNCGLDRQQLAIIVGMIENGVNPEALALVINEMKNELVSFKKVQKG